MSQSYQLGPWTGGVWYSKPPEDLEKDQLSAMENCRIGFAGQVIKRDGCASYEETSAVGGTPPPVLTMCAEFDVDSSTTYTVIVAGSAIYYWNTTSDEWTAITGSVTVTAGYLNTFEWVNANGTLISTNGVDSVPWKWTGTGNAADLTVESRFTKGKHVAWWDNRLWIGNENANSDRVWYSDIGNPDSWEATAYYNIGKEVTALVPMQDVLAVHTKDAIWTLTPTDETTIPYKLEQKSQGGGVDGRSTITLPDKSQVFIRKDGIYRWDNDSDVTKISYQLDSGFWNTVRTDWLHNAFAVYYPARNEVWFFLPVGSTQTYMNQVIVLQQYEKEGSDEFRWYGPYTGWERNCGAMIGDTPHAGGTDGILYDCESGTDDAGTTITAYFTTAAPSPEDDSSITCRWLYTRSYFDSQGDYNVSIEQSAPGVVSSPATINMSGAGFVLGSSLLGQGTLDPIRMVYRDTGLTGYSPHVSLRYINTGLGHRFTFRRVHLQYKPLRWTRKRKTGIE